MSKTQGNLACNQVAFIDLITWTAFVAPLPPGWSFIKPVLGEKDKRIMIVVLPLQVIVNIAMIVVDTLNEGNSSWGTWRDILRFVHEAERLPSAFVSVRFFWCRLDPLPSWNPGAQASFCSAVFWKLWTCNWPLW